MGVYSIAAGYLVTTLLPHSFGVLIPIIALAIPIAVMWPPGSIGGLTAAGRRRLVQRIRIVISSAERRIFALLIGTAVPFRNLIERPGTWTGSLDESAATHFRLFPGTRLDRGALEDGNHDAVTAKDRDAEPVAAL